MGNYIEYDVYAALPRERLGCGKKQVDETEDEAPSEGTARDHRPRRVLGRHGRAIFVLRRGNERLEHLETDPEGAQVHEENPQRGLQGQLHVTFG